MAAGDRNKKGKASDFVRHYGEPTPVCGVKNYGYTTLDPEDVTCLKCIKKIKPKT